MSALSNKEFNKKKEELTKKKIYKVIDAQNVMGYIHKKNRENDDVNIHNKEVIEVSQEDIESDLIDDVIGKLSCSSQEQMQLFADLKNEKSKENTSIQDIDWKNLKTF